MPDDDTVELTKALIRRASVTPADAGCQDVLAERLAAVGFRIERLRFGEVDNLWAVRRTGPPLFVFAGHTDVVPAGPLDHWSSDPFEPFQRDGLLFGRGAADMKGSLAAMITATERFCGATPEHSGSLGFLITSDEEGPAINGTKRVMDHLAAAGTHIDWCLVGEPSSDRQLGDTVRSGRRGSLNGKLSIEGVQGHVAYPQRALNPIHAAAPALTELCAASWDDGSASFPPTSFQISNVNAGTGADNVIPGRLELAFNFRFSTASSVETLQQRTETLLKRHGLNYNLQWHLSGQPFVTEGGRLIEAVRAAVGEITGIEPELSTGGGTSDGRFIAPSGAEVAELGPLNASIHKIDEHVAIADLHGLSQIYEKILQHLLPR